MTMEPRPFTFARAPQILFGAGSFDRIGDLLRRYGRTVAIVTGETALRKSDRWIPLIKQLAAKALSFSQLTISGEPSPRAVDAAVAQCRMKGVCAVCAIGGGSVIDAGKAIAAMLPSGEPVREFLEGVGTRQHDGATVPLIAVPTTAGTGSEATKNAVISEIGPRGFKKSLRHDNFVPAYAVIDPELSRSCPPGLTAACGMDAFTQLLEAYCSPAASVMTDALAYTGLQHVKDCLVPAATRGADDLAARSGMAYAALMSGICLANAGLGIVHGLAAPIGARYVIPHGVVCGTLVGAATRANIGALRRQSPDHPLLSKFACAGMLLSGDYAASADAACDKLVAVIESWAQELNIPRLGDFGIAESEIPKIVDDVVCRTNAVELSRSEMAEIVKSRL
jgi:alcohol dehydrogenase class IV